jgi:hypothetical protein
MVQVLASERFLPWAIGKSETISAIRDYTFTNQLFSAIAPGVGAGPEQNESDEPFGLFSASLRQVESRAIGYG